MRLFKAQNITVKPVFIMWVGGAGGYQKENFETLHCLLNDQKIKFGTFKKYAYTHPSPPTMIYMQHLSLDMISSKQAGLGLSVQLGLLQLELEG